MRRSPVVHGLRRNDATRVANHAPGHRGVDAAHPAAAQDRPLNTAHRQPHAAHPSSTPAASPGLSKVLVFVVENHSLDQMRTEMPYTFSLAERYGYTTSYRALTHPSLGNYIAMAGGSTFGIVDDRNPVAHRSRPLGVLAALDVRKDREHLRRGDA